VAATARLQELADPDRAAARSIAQLEMTDAANRRIAT